MEAEWSGEGASEDREDREEAISKLASQVEQQVKIVVTWFVLYSNNIIYNLLNKVRNRTKLTLLSINFILSYAFS